MCDSPCCVRTAGMDFLNNDSTLWTSFKAESSTLPILYIKTSASGINKTQMSLGLFSFSSC